MSGSGLPDHLDYYEDVDDSYPDLGPIEYPVVVCTIAGCKWGRDASWSELGTDQYGTDWNVEHPPHATTPPPNVSTTEGES